MHDNFSFVKHLEPALIQKRPLSSVTAAFSYVDNVKCYLITIFFVSEVLPPETFIT